MRVWCIIFVMPSENEIEIPDAWRKAVHPRRHGMAALEPGGGWSERMPWYADRSARLEEAMVAFASAEGELGVFSDLPLVTRSELIRSLRTLDGG